MPGGGAMCCDAHGPGPGTCKSKQWSSSPPASPRPLPHVSFFCKTPHPFLLRHHPLRCSLAQRSPKHGHRPFMGLGQWSKCRLWALPLTHGIRTLGADPGVHTVELGSESCRPDLSQILGLVPIFEPAVRWKVGWISGNLGAVWMDAHRAPKGRHPLI